MFLYGAFSFCITNTSAERKLYKGIYVGKPKILPIRNVQTANFRYLDPYWIDRESYLRLLYVIRIPR